MKTKTPLATRIANTAEVRAALKKAKSLYPTLSDPEIFKLGLSKIVTEELEQRDEAERREIMAAAAYSMGYDYLSDPDEDAYVEELLKFHGIKN